MIKTNYDANGRVCTKCNTYKLWDQFSPAPNGPNLKRAACKKCRSSDPKQRVWAKTWRNRHETAMQTAENPLRLKAKTVRKGMNRRGLGAPTTDEIYIWLSSITEWKCFYTEKVLDNRNFSVDHKIPLARGGGNEITNLCICDKETNSLKGTFTDEEFREFLILLNDCSPSLREVMIKRLTYFHKY